MIDSNTFRNDKEPAVIEKEADNIAEISACLTHRGQANTMYDDLSSLTAKLKMSGVSFQKINDEDGATMQAAVITPAQTADANEEITQPLGEAPTADIRVEPTPATPSISTLNWPKAKPALVQNAFSAPAGGILESVAALSGNVEPEIRERNPVRLDVLFTVIGR